MKNFLAAIFVLVALFAGVIIGNGLKESTLDADYIYNMPSLEGFTEIEADINQTSVKLSDSCFTVSFDVTQDQAYSIARGIEGSIGPRPLTHDIFMDVLENFGIQASQVRIDRYENEIYYATIYMKRGNQALELDARPSDSIGLATRLGIPIYFRTDLLRSRGINECAEGI